MHNEGNFTNSVMRAPILRDGHLGQWVNDRPMPQIRAYITTSTVALNDVVYVVGGTDGMEDLKKQGTKYKTALISRPDERGVLQPWIESQPFPGPGISCFTVAATPGFIHIIGGNTDALEPTANVITGVLAADGTISAWEPGPALPTPLWFHNSAVASGRIWTWGGLTGKTSQTATGVVFSAPILGSGRLGRWRAEPQQAHLQKPLYRAANAVAGPFLMTFCPSYPGSKVSNDVVFSYLSPNGLSPWQPIPTGLPMKMFTTCASDYRRGTIFIPGGRVASGQPGLKDVIYFRLTQSARQTIQTLNSQDEIAQSSEITETRVGESSRLGIDAAMQSADGSVPGFLPYEQARRALTAGGGRPLIAYFHMNGSAPSEAQKQKLLQDPGLKALMDRCIFAWVDVKESPQIAQSFGIFRAPTWILYDPQGRELGRAARALTSSELAAGIASVK
jgi:hypothetical protein